MQDDALKMAQWSLGKAFFHIGVHTVLTIPARCITRARRPWEPLLLRYLYLHLRYFTLPSTLFELLHTVPLHLTHRCRDTHRSLPNSL
jgi:hypothetical protein